MTLQETRSNLGSLESVVGESMIAEGAYVIDQRNLPTQIANSGILVGPVLNILLPPLTIERISFRKKSFESMEEAMKCRSTLLPLTEVSMDIYAAYWEKLGARIGRKVKGKLQWDGFQNDKLN